MTIFRFFTPTYELFIMFSYICAMIRNFFKKLFNKQPQTMSFRNITVPQFKEKMAAADTVVLDVRTPDELREGSIDGHIMLNIKHPDFVTEIDELDREKTYLVYCRSGVRSANACQYMTTLGFTKVYNLIGGIQAWNALA